MVEAAESEPKLVSSVGGYVVFEHTDGFRLGKDQNVKADLPDASKFIFRSAGLAEKIAWLLERFCGSGSSEGTSFVTIDDTLRVGVRGGKSPSCGFYEVNGELPHKDQKSFLEVDSGNELIEALMSYYGEKK